MSAIPFGNLTTFALDEVGSLEAPKGTAPWARAMRIELRQMWHDGTTQLHRFQRYLTLMERERGYQQLDDVFGHPFPTMRAFCVAPPPHGVGFDPAVLDALADETRQMTVGEIVAEVQALGEHGTNQYSNQDLDTSKSSAKGTTSRYRIARLKRDHPDIAEALARGEYRSVRAAAKAAGFVRELSPLDYLRRYWRKLSAEDRAKFLAEMLTPAERRLMQAGKWPEEEPAC
jgi:hypothetical protein